jgi:arylsulfatase A-like enzyme
MAYLEQHRDGPFFCIVGFYSPHSPWVAPQSCIDLYDPATLSLPRFPPRLDRQRGRGHFADSELRAARAGYYAQVSEVDRHLGRILDRLEALGIADSTVVVYTSDHGEWLGEHLRYGKGYPAHDCISRVPLIVRRGTAHRGAGRTVHDFVEAVDLAPSILTWAGIPVPSRLQGRPLVLAEGQRSESPRRSALTEGDGWKTLRLDTLRYVLDADGGEMLFDLGRDPDAYEDVSQHTDYAQAVALARHEMLGRLLTRERPLPRAWAY